MACFGGLFYRINIRSKMIIFGHVPILEFKTAIQCLAYRSINVYGILSLH